MAVAAWLLAAIVGLQAKPAAAQADAHARALARASCQTGKQSDSVSSATAALERDPDQLPPRMRLADALVDQGCYQEAVTVLEAGQQTYPRSSELAGKLRDVRSLVTEQTYIEGLTQAAESAKFSRNQLRCTKLADVTACDDALKFKPEDAQLLAARREALTKRANQSSAEAVTVADARAAASEQQRALQANATGSTSESTQVSGRPNSPDAGSAGTGSIRVTARPKTPRRAPTAAPVPGVAPAPEAAPTATVASLGQPETRTFSNEAPAGHSN